MHKLTNILILLSYAGAVFWAVALPVLLRRQALVRRMSPARSHALITRSVLLAVVCLLLLGGTFNKHGFAGLLAPFWRPGPSAVRNLFVVNADGTGLHRITRSGEVESRPVWSPDGKTLAFVRFNLGDQTREIRAIAPDGSGERQVSVLGNYPAWSPDGTRLAYTCAGAASPEIFVAPAAGGNGTDLTAAVRDDTKTLPAWSPRSDRLAFIAGGMNLWVIGADGSHPVRLVGGLATSGPAYLDAPSWSPDGHTIVFALKPSSGTGHIWIVDANTRLVANLTRTPQQSERHPTWSPDGRRLAFLTDGRLTLINADGSGRRQIGRLDASGEPPRWSPDGQWLAISNSQHSGSGWLYLAQVDGPGLRPLTPPALGAEQPCWSPDGRRLAFVGVPVEARYSSGFAGGRGVLTWLCYVLLGPLALLFGQAAFRRRSASRARWLGITVGILTLALFAASLVYTGLALWAIAHA
jgi:Tol biopolymer transport system component